MCVNRAEVADTGLAGLVEQGRGDAEHRQVDRTGEAEPDDAVPRVVPQQRLAFVPVRRTDPVLLQCRVEVDDVRYHGRADDPDGQAQLGATTEVWNDTGGELPVVLTAGREEYVDETDADECEQRDDRQFETAVAALLQCQDDERDDGGDEPSL